MRCLLVVLRVVCLCFDCCLTCVLRVVYCIYSFVCLLCLFRMLHVCCVLGLVACCSWVYCLFVNSVVCWFGFLFVGCLLFGGYCVVLFVLLSYCCC